MPGRDHFEALTKRTYRQSVVHLLESEYKIIGSHRVLEQLAEDMEDLNRQYFGDQAKMAPGVLCWRTRVAGGPEDHLRQADRGLQGQDNLPAAG